MIRLTARLYYIAKLSKAMKWLKIKLPLSCQICPVIDGRLTVECPVVLLTCLPSLDGKLERFVTKKVAKVIAKVDSDRL